MKLDRLIAKFKKFKKHTNSELDGITEDLNTFEERLESIETLTGEGYDSQSKVVEDITQQLNEHTEIINLAIDGFKNEQIPSRVLDLEHKFRDSIHVVSARLHTIESYKGKLDDELQSISRFESDIGQKVNNITRRLDISTGAVADRLESLERKADCTHKALDSTTASIIDDHEETKAALRHAQSHIESLQLSLNNCVVMISELQEFNRHYNSVELSGDDFTRTENDVPHPAIWQEVPVECSEEALLPKTAYTLANDASSIISPTYEESRAQLISMCLERNINCNEYDTWVNVAEAIEKYDAKKVFN